MMAVPTQDELEAISESTGFQARTLEVVTRLLDVLQAITDDPVLDGRVVLKGGTALNGFHADWPRLSVDIDLSYLGTPSLDDALAARPRIDGALRRILADRGYEAPDEPTRPGGGKWTAPFASHFGGTRELRIDLAYVDRQLLFDPVRMSSFPLGGNAATNVLVVDRREAFAGKLRAMFTRHYGRDVFDAAEFLSAGTPDWPSIRPAFLAYAAAGHANPRRFSVDRVAVPSGEDGALPA